VNEFRLRVQKMHNQLPFTKNPKTLLTERAGKPANTEYVPTANSWLINPLIAHALLSAVKAALFFQPLPTDKQIENVGHSPWPHATSKTSAVPSSTWPEIKHALFTFQTSNA
jgi:hypothetical protein